MIFHLSGSGKWWCNKKLDNIAYDMRLTQMGVIKIRNRLIEKGLLIKGVGNRLRTSDKLNKVYFMDESDLQKLNKVDAKLNKVYSKTKLSITKTPVENNKRLTIEKKDNNYPQAQAQNPIVEGQGYANAKLRYQTLKRRLTSKVGVN